MKVILAGFAKTGTKTMASALDTLGYEVYDYLEHFWHHGKDWNKILTTGGTVDDFKRMYEDVDAIVDTPIFFFWEQIHQAYPDALIILTTRDEKSWIKSWEKQMKTFNSDIYFRLMWALSPLGWATHKYFGTWSIALYGFEVPHVWTQIPVNHMMMLNRYRMHNEYVLQHAPKDKLLVFDVRDGWEPLCKFLGKAVPEISFPHKNIGGSVVKQQLQENAIMRRISRHTMVAGALWLSFGSIAIFFVGRSIMKKWCTDVLCLKNVFKFR